MKHTLFVQLTAAELVCVLSVAIGCVVCLALLALQRVGFATQVLDLVRRRNLGRIARQALLARLEEVLGPAVIKVLDDPLAPAQLGDAVLAAQAL